VRPRPSLRHAADCSGVAESKGARVQPNTRGRRAKGTAGPSHCCPAPPGRIAAASGPPAPAPPAPVAATPATTAAMSSQRGQCSLRDRGGRPGGGAQPSRDLYTGAHPQPPAARTAGSSSGAADPWLELQLLHSSLSRLPTDPWLGLVRRMRAAGGRPPRPAVSLNAHLRDRPRPQTSASSVLCMGTCRSSPAQRGAVRSRKSARRPRATGEAPLSEGSSGTPEALAAAPPRAPPAHTGGGRATGPAACAGSARRPPAAAAAA
jgi:hypothetical protein